MKKQLDTIPSDDKSSHFCESSLVFYFYIFTPTALWHSAWCCGKPAGPTSLLKIWVVEFRISLSFSQQKHWLHIWKSHALVTEGQDGQPEWHPRERKCALDDTMTHKQRRCTVWILNLFEHQSLKPWSEKALRSSKQIHSYFELERTACKASSGRKTMILKRNFDDQNALRMGW